MFEKALELSGQTMLEEIMYYYEFMEYKERNYERGLEFIKKFQETGKK